MVGLFLMLWLSLCWLWLCVGSGTVLALALCWLWLCSAMALAALRWRSLLCDDVRCSAMAVDVGRSSLGRLDGMNEWGLLLKRRAHNLL